MNDRLRICLAIVAAVASLPASAGIALNPDVRQDTIARTICAPGYVDSIRPPASYTDNIKRKLLKQSKIDAARAKEYELNYTVPLDLGGHPRSLDNLQLRPLSGPDGIRRKASVEVKLQCLVCSGRVPLAEAQKAIYGDWQGTYGHYYRVKCRSRSESDE